MKKIIILLLLIANFTYTNAQTKYKKYYDNGQLMKVGKLINKTKTGKWKEYFENGQLQSVGKYKINAEGNAYKTGKWKSYYKTGELKEKGYYEGIKKRNNSGDFYQKTGKWIYFDLFGDENKFIFNYKNGVNKGLQQIFHKNGWLYSAAIYYNKGKDAHFIMYYPSGKVQLQLEIKNNESQGRYLKFYENGQVKLDGEKNNGAFNGIVKIYHKNGQLYQIQEWEGRYNYEKLINIKVCYNTNGKPIDKGTLKDDNGTLKEYINDELVNIVTIENGRKKENQVYILDIWNNWERLNNVAWDLYERTKDKTLNKFTLKWIERSIQLDKNYYNLDSYCAFLYRDKQYEKAIKIGLQSIQLGKKNNIDTTETAKLVAEIKEKINKRLLIKSFKYIRD